MSGKGRFRGPVGAFTLARDLHRVMIADDTNSRSGLWRAHRASPSRRSRCGHTSPPPAPPLLRRVNSIPSTPLRRHFVRGLGFALVTRASGSSTTQRVVSPIEFTRRIRGASTLRW